MRKLLSFFLCLLMLFPFFAAAEDLSFTVFPSLIRPGKMERVSFSSSEAGTAQFSLLDASGETHLVIRDSLSVSIGENHLTWDGLDAAGIAVAPGNYQLSLRLADHEIKQPITIGQPSPRIISVSADDSMEAYRAWPFVIEVNEPGTLTMRIKAAKNGSWLTAQAWQVNEGKTSLSWDGNAENQPIAPGAYTLQFVLINSENASSTARQMNLTILMTAASAQAQPARVMTPSAVTTQETEHSYWTYPIGDLDEAALWEIMMQPMTVIDGNQKEVYRLRKTPDSSMSKDNVVGEITYASQGVHVLETLDNGWTLVEAYNSSYGPNCASRRGYGVTDDLIQGYVKTSLLKTITPRTDYALLIDKLEQTMYIYSEGKCIGSLLVSTGLNNSKQSWNETPAGEFVMISKIGGFAAGNLWCAYGMRINGGCAIHEVPYIGNNDTEPSRRDYSTTVKMLGQKASHGCIRVQKASNEGGQNIKWLWDNISKNTKVLIWDDTGRIRPYPVADDYELYYNPIGGQYYHENQYCPGVKERFLPLSPFTYGELETEAFSKLTPCPKCTLLLKKSQIDAMNRLENPDLQ